MRICVIFVTVHIARFARPSRFAVTRPDTALWLARIAWTVLVDFTEHRRLNYRGRDGVDGDAVLCELLAQRLGEADHRRLGSTVGRGPRITLLAGRGTHNSLVITDLIYTYPSGDSRAGAIEKSRAWEPADDNPDWASVTI